MHDLSRKLSSDLYIPSPKGLDYFPFQKAGIEYCYENKNHNTLIGDEPGLGKTIQFIGFCNLVGAMNILVVCPASLVLNWAREIEKWHTGNPTIQVISSGNQTLNPTIDVHIVSYSLTINKKIQAFLQRKRPDAMTIDEVHYLKNPEAKRTQATYTSSGNIVQGASNVIALSGTPIINRPKEIYETIRALCFKAINYMEYETFALRYCGAYYDQMGFHDDGASNLPELGRRLRGDFMVRRKKVDVLKDLPGKTIQLVSLHQSTQAKRLVKEMNKFDIEKAANMKGVAITFEGISEMRRELGVEKVPAVLEYVKTQLESGRRKIVLFGYHQEVLVLLAEGLEEYGSVLMYGKTPKMARQGIVDRFQTDPECRVFVGNIITCGEGITLTASDYLCFAEPSWVPGQNDQVIDRVHRIGQVNGVLAEFLIYEESLDENVLRSQSRKKKNINQVME